MEKITQRHLQESTNDRNYDASFIHTSLPVSDFENYKHLIFVAQRVPNPSNLCDLFFTNNNIRGVLSIRCFPFLACLSWFYLSNILISFSISSNTQSEKRHLCQTIANCVTTNIHRIQNGRNKHYFSVNAGQGTWTQLTYRELINNLLHSFRAISFKINYHMYFCVISKQMASATLKANN